MQRFYIHDTDLRSKVWLRDLHLIHQLTKVLRSAIGDDFILFDGQGNDRVYKLEHLDSKEVLFRHVSDVDSLAGLDLDLYWSTLNKRDKDELVVQKATELGVRALHPVVGQRSQVSKFDHERAEKIIIEASEQSGRSFLPALKDRKQLAESLAVCADRTIVYLDQHSDVKISQQLNSGDSVSLFVGPEGGWTDQELDMFKAKGAQGCSVSKTILRAETAAIVGLGMAANEI